MKRFLRNCRSRRLIYFLLCFLFLPNARILAQDSLIYVHGALYNTTGEPIRNVSVTAGRTKGTLTDGLGQYSIQVPKNSVLKFTASGFTGKEVVVGRNSVINVTLDFNINNLNEVVVVGYGNQKRATLTGAVSTVKGGELAAVPVGNVTNSLVGRLPGLISKQESGEPGHDAAAISIRGYGPALVVIDGVQTVQDNIGNLDPNEIESVTILKDAAAAIYGSRSGNGVVLVTTKRGKIGRPTVSFGSSYTAQSVTTFPKPVNSGQYAQIMREAQINSGTAPNQTRFSDMDVQKYYAGNDPAYPNTNWWKEINRDWSPLQQHSVSVAGGSDNIKYFGLIGYTQQDGIYRTGDNVFKRYNIRSNIDARITKGLTFSMDLSGSMGTLDAPVRAQSDLWANFFNNQPVYPASLPDPTKLAFTGYAYTALYNTSKYWGGYNDSFPTTLRTTASLLYEIPGVRGLSVKAFVNYTGFSYRNKYWSKNQNSYLYDAASKTYTVAGSTGITNLSEGNFRAALLTPQISVNYNTVIHHDHEIRALALFESIDYSDNSSSAYREGFITNQVDQLFAGGLVNQKSNGSATQNGRASYVGRIDYAYKNKYLLQLTGRVDGASVFPANTRWGFFPSVSAAWRASEEGFLQNVSWIQNLKLRASYSNTGYDGTGNYQYITGYGFGNNYLFGQTTNIGIVTTGLPNPNITWEKISTYNAGADFSFLHDKVYGAVDVFYRNVDGILTTRQTSLPSTFGATLPLENLNSQNNRGFELMLGTKGNVGKVFYDISGNVTWARAKWGHVEEPGYTDPDQKRLYQRSDQWTDVFFGYRSAGLFTSQSEIDQLGYDQDGQNNKSLHPGDIKYLDVNKDGKVDFRDQVQIGYGNTPQVIYGFNFHVEYRDFDFSALVQGAARYNVQIVYGIDSYRTPPEVLFNERWTETNNKADATFPRQYFGNNSNNSLGSDFSVKSAAYARLKNLVLGYRLPKAILSKIGISQFRIYVAGTNLVTIDGLKKYAIDPEAPGFTRGWSYPQQKNISVGVNLTF